MNCKKVDELLHMYCQLDEDNPLRIELEAHMLDCERCAAKFNLDSIPFPAFELNEHLNSNIREAKIDIEAVVMQRIYEEEEWFAPIPSKKYQFSKAFKRNFSAVIACCLALFTLAIFGFVYDSYKKMNQPETATVSGIVDVARATSDQIVHASIFTNTVPVTRNSEPIVLQVVPTFPQYYVALSFIGIIGALLLIGWLKRIRQ